MLETVSSLVRVNRMNRRDKPTMVAAYRIFQSFPRLYELNLRKDLRVLQYLHL